MQINYNCTLTLMLTYQSELCDSMATVQHKDNWGRPGACAMATYVCLCLRVCKLARNTFSSSFSQNAFFFFFANWRVVSLFVFHTSFTQDVKNKLLMGRFIYLSACIVSETTDYIWIKFRRWLIYLKISWLFFIFLLAN
jgi:hypothetical protein